MNHETPNAHKTKNIPFSLLLISCGAIAAAMFSLALIYGKTPLYGIDFRAFYTAGKIAQRGGALYDLTHQFAVQRAIWPALDVQEHLLPYFNPPFAALPLALVAFLPPVPAFVVWTILETLLLTALLRVLAAHLSPDKPRARLAFIFCAITFVPILLALLNGQFSILLALSVAMAWKNFRDETPRGELGGGAWLALLAIKPQLLLVPLALLLWKKRGRALLGMFAALAVLGAISLWMVGVPGLLQFKKLLAQAASWSDAYGIHPQAMHSWRGLVAKLLNTNDPAATQTFWLLGCAVAMIALLVSWRGAWRASSGRFDLTFAQLILSATFCSAHLNAHDLSLWLVAGALITRATSDASTRAELSRKLLRALPLLGYFATLAWFVLMLSKVPILQLTVFFQIFALGVLTWVSCRQEARVLATKSGGTKSGI